jgi:hypothetical protein
MYTGVMPDRKLLRSVWGPLAPSLRMEFLITEEIIDNGLKQIMIRLTEGHKSLIKNHIDLSVLSVFGSPTCCGASLFDGRCRLNWVGPVLRLLQ